jgi:hypothetical protein
MREQRMAQWGGSGGGWSGSWYSLPSPDTNFLTGRSLVCKWGEEAAKRQLWWERHEERGKQRVEERLSSLSSSSSSSRRKHIIPFVFLSQTSSNLSYQFDWSKDESLVLQTNWSTKQQQNSKHDMTDAWVKTTCYRFHTANKDPHGQPQTRET